MSILAPTYRHSASSGNAFREAPDTFLWRYALGNKSVANSKMATGSAVEIGLAAYLRGEHIDYAIDVAAASYNDALLGEIGPEREDIPALVTEAAKAFAPFGKFLTYQSTLKLDAGVHYGLRFPVIAYTDFGYPDFTVDSKVTWRLPSAPDFSHVCQLAVYWRLQDARPQKLAYITPKKHAVYDVPEEDLERGWRVMLSTWRRIEQLDARCSSAGDAISLIPVNPDNFRWKGADMARVLETWGV